MTSCVRRDSRASMRRNLTSIALQCIYQYKWLVIGSEPDVEVYMAS